ncbi:MAG: hypothetical protein BMS9Abin29_0850 [Gemmatimonadota bacterium]|nr:MAG: hypothetical protein BMS9Abin29_0850 [Gemmatimonadota bacterium]
MLGSVRTKKPLRLIPLVGCVMFGSVFPYHAAGQSGDHDRWFPEESYFSAPVAAPREPTFALRGIWTDVFTNTTAPGERDSFSFDGVDGLPRELQGEAAMGGHVRIWRPAEWAGGGVILGIQTGVFGRFRLEVSSSDLISSDWLVAFPAEFALGRWSARVRFTHWSAHIGDELIETTGAQRLDFTSETFDGMAAYDFGAIRLYGGGGLVTRSSLENEEQLGPKFSDNGFVQAGAEGRWLAWKDGRFGVETALDWQASDRVDWRGSVSAVAGVTVQDGARSASLRALFHDGPSPMGQFFLTDERYWGFELLLAF